MTEKGNTNEIRWPKAMALGFGLSHRKRGSAALESVDLSSGKEQRISPAQSKASDHIAPEFINITNSFSLNSNSRSSVRAQVMRDYHRRRIQKRNGQRSTSPTSTSIPASLSAKDQTHKFRIDGGSKERQWGRGGHPVRKLAPRTAEIAQHDMASNKSFKGKSRLDDIDISLQKSHPVADDPSYYLFSKPSSISLGGEPGETIHEIQFGQVEHLFSMNTSSELPILYNSVAPGSLDPFSAMSLVITPRTQLLLHHYCKLLCMT